MDSIVAEKTGSIHHITSSITHNTHTESHLGVFGCEMGVLWLHFRSGCIFRHFLHRRQIIYHVSPGERPCELPPKHWELPRPQQYVLHLTWFGHWSLTSGQGLRIIFAKLKRRSHWVDVSIINQRRISPTQCLPC